MATLACPGFRATGPGRGKRGLAGLMPGNFRDIFRLTRQCVPVDHFVTTV